MELQPGKNFTIVRQLGMPGDVATYYVQAVVKNSETGVVISTVNLTDQGNQRFTGAFQVPQDTSGQGMNIDITNTVYTDSGYSTQSNIYTIDNQAYLVFDRLLSRNVAVGGFGADNVDYKRVKKIVEEVVATIKLPEAPVMEKTEAVDLSPVLNSISAMSSKMDQLDTRNRDTGVIASVNKIKTEISKSVDLKEIHSKLNKIYEVIYSVMEDNGKSRESITNEMTDVLETSKKMLEKLEETVVKVNTYAEDSRIGTDAERLKEVKKYVKELGESLKKVFQEQFGNDENQAKNLMNAFVKMSTREESAEPKEKKMESPYLDHANKLIQS